MIPSLAFAAGRDGVVACRDGHLVDLAGGPPELAARDLTPLLAAGRGVWERATEFVRHAPFAPTDEADDAELGMPFAVADYVDFYSSEHHARNVGDIFRGSPDLPRAWLELPIGYHGRAGTVVVSGTDIRRPHGIRAVDGTPEFGPCLKLDFEAEVAFVVGTPSETPVRTEQFRDHVFGITLLNDWSARDIQNFEYVPLGPFLGKSFATSISPWITPLAALGEAWVDAPAKTPAAYLAEDRPNGLDLQLEVELNGSVLTRPPFASMHWSAAQQLAHLTVNGATLRTGDLYASGTVSGPDREQVGSLLELTRNGTTGRFLADGDTVVLRATAPGGIVLGQVAGTVIAS